MQSLNARTDSSSSELTVQQYQAQNHVLEQLEEKIRSLLRQQPKQNTAVIKLKRDFERVQLRTSQMQELATKKISCIQNIQKSNASSYNNHSNNNSSYNPFSNGSADHRSSSFNDNNEPANILAEQQRLQQLQLQEDRLHEEIMREREEEIRNINHGMHTVNEIFKDLAHIVGQQQEQVDQIENQMEDSRANAESGLAQVEKANEKYGQQCSIQ